MQKFGFRFTLQRERKRGRKNLLFLLFSSKSTLSLCTATRWSADLQEGSEWDWVREESYEKEEDKEDEEQQNEKDKKKKEE